MVSVLDFIMLGAILGIVFALRRIIMLERRILSLEKLLLKRRTTAKKK